MDVDDAAERVAFTARARKWLSELPVGDGVQLPDEAESSLRRAFVTHLHSGRHGHTPTGILRSELAWR